MPLTSALKRWRLGGLYEFRASLVYTLNFRIAKATW